MGNGTFTLQILNLTVKVSSTTLVTSLASSLNSVDPSFLTVSLSSVSPTVCGQAAVDTYITYGHPSGTALPIMQVLNVVGSLSADVYPYIDSVDSTQPVPGTLGLYQINYTPVRAGIYDISVQIGGKSVATTLTTVQVQPGPEYAATSTHNISQVNVQGVQQYFSVQVRDKFGNALVGPIAQTSSFLLTMQGSSDSCQSSSAELSVPLVQMDSGPYTDAVYSFSYTPVQSGSFETSVKLVTQVCKRAIGHCYIILI